MENWNKFIETYDISFLEKLDKKEIKNNIESIDNFKGLKRIAELY